MDDDTVITKVEKTLKPKDPRRVESGKRLAAISREAKLRKAEERRVAQTAPEEDGNTLIYAGVTAAVVGGVYFAYRSLSTKSDEKPDVKPRVERSVQPTKPKFDEFNSD